MNVYLTTSYLYKKRKLDKKASLYDCLDTEIDNFFNRCNTFAKVYESSYFVQQKGFLRIIKVRLPNPTMKQGKSGGFRLILCCNSNTQNIAILTAYPKMGKLRKDDLEVDELAKLLKEMKTDIDKSRLVEYPFKKKTNKEKE